MAKVTTFKNQSRYTRYFFSSRSNDLTAFFTFWLSNRGVVKTKGKEEKTCYTHYFWHFNRYKPRNDFYFGDIKKSLLFAFFGIFLSEGFC